jgi:putative flippase GtrA
VKAINTVFSELGTLFRYGLVGVLAVGLHAACAVMLVLMGAAPSVASVAGYLSGFLVSALGQHYFTFRSKEPFPSTLPKLLLVGLVGILFNGLVAPLAMFVFAMPSGWAVTLVAFCTPVLVFLLLRFWVFASGSQR